MLEHGSFVDSRASQLTGNEVDESNINPLEVIRRSGQRKLLKIYAKVAEKLSTVSKKRLQLSDLVIQDHIPDIRLVLNFKLLHFII